LKTFGYLSEVQFLPPAQPVGQAPVTTEPTETAIAPAEAGATDSVVAASASTIYVSLDGKNSNPGSSSAPLRTIQKAVNRAKPGDTIVVGPGRWKSKSGLNYVDWQPSDGRGAKGTSDAPITLKAQNPATTTDASSRTTLVGSGDSYGIIVADTAWVVVDGFELTNFYTGIVVADSSHIKVTRNVMRSNTMSGAECIPCANSTFDGNAFEDPGPAWNPNDDSTQYGFQDYGLAVRGADSTNNKITNNRFSGKANQALSVKFGAGSTYVGDNRWEGCMLTCLYVGQNDDEGRDDNTVHDIAIADNTFVDGRDPSTGAYYRLRTPIAVRNAANTIIRDNDFVHTHYAPIRVLPCGDRTSCKAANGIKPVGVTITGNTMRSPMPTDPSAKVTEYWAAIDLTGRGFKGDVISISDNNISDYRTAFTIANAPTYAAAETSAPPTLDLGENKFTNVRKTKPVKQ
jgi:hypothetical protein